LHDEGQQEMAGAWLEVRAVQEEVPKEPDIGATQQEAPEEPDVEDETDDQSQVIYILDQF
jgi:hypothetical protein